MPEAGIWQRRARYGSIFPALKAAAAGRPSGGDAGGRPFMSGENAGTEVVTEIITEAQDADEAEELLVEEISIDGMCGVY
jgi:mycofactocin precursor